MDSLPRRVTNPVFHHKSIRYVERSGASVARAKRKVDAEAATTLFPQAFVAETEGHWAANDRSLQDQVAKMRNLVASQWRKVRRWLQTCSEVDLAEWHRRWAYLPHRSEYAADAVFQIERRKAGASCG